MIVRPSAENPKYCVECGTTLNWNNKHGYCQDCYVASGAKRRKMREYQRSYRTKSTLGFEPVQRECLKCGKSFVADGRFNRSCHQCKKVQETLGRVYTVMTGGYVNG